MLIDEGPTISLGRANADGPSVPMATFRREFSYRKTEQPPWSELDGP